MTVATRALPVPPPLHAAHAGGGLPGALVVSLDLELHWGVRDLVRPTGAWRDRLVSARAVVPMLLDLFEERGIAATWATVGFLFARSRHELLRFAPVRRPAYANAALAPWGEPLGDGEADDPLHYAPSLVDAIRRRPAQEIATHTFSHYYCREPGQDREAFRADLASAVAIARAHDVTLRSIVFPRNQHEPRYDDLLADAGITCYRGNQRAWMYRAADGRANTPVVRAARLLDAYVAVAGAHTTPWADVPRAQGLCDVPASHFLRPFAPALAAADGLRLRRIARSIERAAVAGEVVHLWWHPHNAGLHTREWLAFLRRVLDVFARCRDAHGMLSLTMAEAAALARRHAQPGGTRP